MMPKPRQFRPEVGEVLEERVVLSRVGTALALSAGVAGRPAAQVGPLQVRGTSHGASLGPVGAIGDSYTDEYRTYLGEARGHARNWVEILNVTRGVNFGPFTGRSRGEPRNGGFAFNWARSGATSSDMVNNQLPGLAAQVARGQVKTAWMFVGGNDFLYVFSALQNGQVAPADAAGVLRQTEATLKSNALTAVNTLLAANPGVHLVVSTLPHIATLPAAKLAESLSPLVKPLLALTSELIADYNAFLARAVSGNPRVALVDLAASTNRLATAPGKVPFGGQAIDLNAPGDDFHHFFLSDSIHVGTVAQGIIANAFLDAVDTRFGRQVRPLSQTEIVRFARKVQSAAGSAIR